MSEWRLIKWLLSFISDVKWKVIVAVSLGIISNLSVVAIPLIGVREVLLILNDQNAQPIQALFMMLICGGMRGITRYGEQYMNHDIAFSLLAKIREEMFETIRRLGPAKLSGKKSGDLVAAITSDVEALEVFFAHTISPVLIATGTTIVTVGFAWMSSPVIACMLLAGQLLVGVVIPIIGYHKSRFLGDDYQKAFVNLNQAVMEDSNSLQDITQYSLEKEQLAKLDGAGRTLNSQYKKRLTQESNLRIISEIVLLLTAICIFILGAHLQLSLTIVLTSVILSLSSFGSVLALSGLGSALLTTFASARRLADLTNEPSIVDFSKSLDKVNQMNGGSFEAVTFSYDQQIQPVISDLSLQIEKKTVIGIGGESGSGKSTLLKLFMRYWDPDKGTITISGAPLPTIQETVLHALEGVMEQTTFIFEDTIAANIGLGKKDATIEEIKSASEKAALHQWIESLPEKYQTKIGGNTRNISDGERQRIGLARLFLHDAPFLLLDEPTSNLDYLNEQAILNVLKAGVIDKTVVLVSHRETTLAIADYQYILDKGHLIKA